uniref:14-3-3 domain-containing protein n=1 Tax=Euplotes harpa TaxID=151035 RepID=A0A7S3JEB4_9SPIT|mmetsp:Transcript_32857/g.37626  ORF Transcript_32857/g.37626 Transcript_32857/m.37626 type:complete len:246 (+) Transcript_32857:24-761(+)
MKESKDDLLYLAKLAEQAERYDEMVEYATAFSKKESQQLSLEERNILSVAYKNVVGSRRAAWRVLNSIEQKESKKDKGKDNVEKVRQYKSQIEEELLKLCREILDLLKSHLIPQSTDPEAKVFYYKMEGDYYRYISEFTRGAEKEDAATKSKNSYQEAHLIAEKDLEATHPIRLGLALNYSVFFYEILQEREKACEMAKTAFDDAISGLDNVSDEYYKDSTLIMQLLRDNLTLWTSDMPEEETDK